ncbi:response regulator [Sulfitobacter sp. F26169L]|uniref:response regulator n=1 Tax=Sulfitobacter sp. F26169L TaxID=2996015 RepID=UPI002260A90A|nr:response regulator [Sulfitobacter sp. F26169L]MCX7566984.1 response regulator [Sulfitobacter sp. F26169L]
MSLPVEVIGPEERAFPRIIKTLLLDDSTFDRARIRRMSQNTNLLLDLTEVCDVTELKDAIAEQEFDLILIDYRLPQGDGLDVLAHIQQSELNSDVATIMITGEGDMQTAVTAMRNGCHDFLTKDAMTADHLRTAMIGAIRMAQDHREEIARTAHQQEVIRNGLTAALQTHEVQGTVVALFKDQFREAMHAACSNVFAPEDHSDLESLLAALGEDDEFCFN